MRTRIQLYADNGTAYNPVTKKNERNVELIDTYFGTSSPMTEERQMRTFGKTDFANTAVRFTVRLPDNVDLALMDGKHYEVATGRNYRSDSIVYLREVSAW